MPLLITAKRHFDEDIQRARDVLAHARQLPAGRLRDDTLRASWMMAVGACDAFFCDAFSDLVSRALRAKDLEPRIEIPGRLGNLRIPAMAVLRQASGGWRWRMAARVLMEDESVLSIEKIKSLFNQFCRDSTKLLTPRSIEPWLIHASAKQRLFGISRQNYQVLPVAQKPSARYAATAKFTDRFDVIFQRRHDCIHNCDRPKVSLQPISPSVVEKAISDVEFLVTRSHQTLSAEFTTYLTSLGFSGQTRNQVCM